MKQLVIIEVKRKKQRRGESVSEKERESVREEKRQRRWVIIMCPDNIVGWCG